MIRPIISICIPTYSRVEILKNTLESIFSQNVSSELYEVCISDNSPTDETKDMLNDFFADKTNITYSKATCEGYYNSIEVLKLGKGKFLKLHNNYSKFNSCMLEQFITRLSECENTMPVIFFSFGSVKLAKECVNYPDFNSFLNAISYFSTWSTSFGIWKKDFDCIMSKNTELDKMFPHTSLLFAMTDNSSFIVDNALYFENQNIGKKGGYNLPETFGIRYLGMCRALLADKKIEEQTFQKIKFGILQFIADWYVKVTNFSDKYTFSFENWEKNVTNIYGDYGVNFIKAYERKSKLKVLIKKILKWY